MIAGAQAGGTGLALIAGALTLWVTFVPCFIWIFAGAPLIDWLEQQPRLKAALAGITAAVVGVIANLSVWFALHVFFDTVTPFTAGPLTTVLPDVTTLQPFALGLAVLAGVLLLLRHMPLLWVLFICAAISGTTAMF
jgi:chromate transporter